MGRDHVPLWRAQEVLRLDLCSKGNKGSKGSKGRKGRTDSKA